MTKSSPFKDRKHALLSASGAESWLECGQYVVAKELYPQDASDFAKEGTQAHQCAEFLLKNKYKGTNLEPNYADSDMEFYVNEYVGYIEELCNELKSKSDDTSIFIEQELRFDNIVPDGFGTGDCVIISGDELHIIDLKYGKGIAKYADHNPQLMLYGLGALNLFGDWYEFKRIGLHIIQPRLDTNSYWLTTPEQLKDWSRSVKERAEDIVLRHNFTANPGKVQCRFCPIKDTCRERANSFMKILNKFNKEKKL